MFSNVNPRMGEDGCVIMICHAWLHDTLCSSAKFVEKSSSSVGLGYEHSDIRLQIWDIVFKYLRMLKLPLESEWIKDQSDEKGAEDTQITCKLE